MNRKWISILSSLLLALLFSSVAAAQGGVDWTASYWNNTSLSGDPVLVRTENDLDHDWGRGAPAPVVDDDRFSARWTGTLDIPAGTYRFNLTTDDGARLYIDGRRVIDAWEVQPATTYSVETTIPADPVAIEVQYFENTGLAEIELTWETVDTPTDAWQAEYFDNTTLSGAPVLVDTVPAIDFNWRTDSPAPDRLDPDAFSARWSRDLDLAAGTYRFTMSVDDGGRLYVNNQLVIDRFIDQAATTYTAQVTVPGGPVPVVMEYYESGGVASASLRWQRLSGAGDGRGSVVIVDDRDNGFVWGGPAGAWQAEPEGYENSLQWTENSRSRNDNYNWGVWYPDLEADVYEVAVYVPDRFSTTSQARYWVSHAGGFDLTVVDQSANGGRWVTLGTYSFSGTSEDYVSLADVTLETDETRLVAYDAVRFESVTEGEGVAQMALDRVSARAGETIQVTGEGFPPFRVIYLQLGPPGTEPFGRYAQGQTDANGNVSLTFTVPAAWPDGEPVTADRLVAVLITTDGTRATESFQYEG